MNKETSCCVPQRPTRERSEPDRETAGQQPAKGTGPRYLDDMVHLSGGGFLMGTDSREGFPADGEGPLHKVRLKPFQLDAHLVTNEQFAAFIEETDYISDADRYGWTFVFHLLLPRDFPPTRAIAGAPWWRQVEGASWRHPEGLHSSIDDRLDHPVIHVSWNDAMAFAQWAGKRLPSEAEWEYAARGGLVQARYAWGDELTPDSVHRCNIWQGTFPTENSCEDGYLSTSPVGSYAPNGYGLYDTAGNVWEWCADWFSPRTYTGLERIDPTGPENGEHRVIRGGSYLCHESYCNRYRVAARSHSEPDSSTGNTGFRCARDA